MSSNATDNRKPTIRFPRRVVILGNEVSGWLAAALLARQLRPLDCRVTVVCDGESQEPFRAGCTQPSFGGLLRNLGIHEHHLLQACRGTYHLATQVCDWVRPGTDFWQPVGFDPHSVEGLNLFDAWFSERRQGRLLRPFHSYCLHWAAAMAGRSPHSFSGNSPLAASGRYGFHLDLQDLRCWLRTAALEAAAEEVPGKISRIFPNGRGGIAQVRLQDGKAVPGDLFLDCRQTAQLSMRSDNDAAAVPQHRSLCDRLVTFRLPAARQIPSSDRIQALSSGWAWQVPLADQTDCCYVFSSRFTDDQQALQEVLQTVSGEQTSADISCEFASVAALPRPDTFWKDNVVYPALAGSQLSPLAGMNLHLLQTGVELFLEHFPERSGNPAGRDEFNRQMQRVTAEVQDLIQLQAVLSQRKEPFWTATRNEPLTDAAQQLLELYDHNGSLPGLSPFSLPADHYRYLFLAAGRLPRHPSLQATTVSPANIQKSLREILKRNDTVLRDLPMHEELLDWVHAPPAQTQSA